jgi:N-methylhydantoinase A/oxoprolinase/acetone carboxylase beta subunit
MAAEYFSRALQRPNLLSFDMGGTTAKSVLIKDGCVTISNECEVGRVARFKKGSGIPLKLPFVDLLEIGAGGGSIARLSSLGLIQVGPDSASSVPGPVCYGLGGDMPTVTDADLVLGYLNQDYFLGGEMKLDLKSAKDQIARHFEPLSVDAEEAAWRIHDLVNENMASAAKIHLAEKGQHPSGLSMIALGGAGPVHAVGVAKQLGIPEVIIPPWAGVLSALGFFAAPVSFDLVATFQERLATLRVESLKDTVDRLKADISRFLDAALPEISFVTRLEVQYLGQGVGVSLHLDKGYVSEANLGAKLQADFEAEYRRLFGRIYGDVALEIVSVHVVGSLTGDEFSLPRKLASSGTNQVVKGTRQAYSPSRKRCIAHTVYERALLPVGYRIDGPALVEERETTTLVGEEMSATVHETGALIITLNQ